MKKILLVSSSSGGHIYPCIYLGEKLREKNYQITYLGIKGQMEENIIKDNIKLLNIENSFRKTLNITGINKVYKERNTIKNLIREHDCIVCFGGFISFLVAIINFKNKKILMHEQNVVLGDSIKYSYPFIDKLLISFDNDLLKLKKAKYTANPCITRVLTRTDINIRKPKIMFIFGSLSSLSCLKVVKEFITKYKIDNQILVVTSNKYNYLFKDITSKNILIKSFIDMKVELKEYDFVFTRGGASTLVELLKARVEICCIPSPYVKNNHQQKNASYLLSKGLIRVIEETDFTPEAIINQINNLEPRNNFNIEFDPIERIIQEIEND
jgi:UDP-N-acetylglucosamine--N-acetylmuramyl-(pentapeptide) pyrophosphoryl-undecaprenol N-acetylglucosamine transferase